MTFRSEPGVEYITVPAVGSQLRLYPQAFVHQAGPWFHALRAEIPWTTEYYLMFGKQRAAPRLISWHGDADAVYTYSGLRHAPKSWTPALLQIKSQIEALLQEQFNSVLLNLYRHGQDSMGWHADNEPELGPQPVIASLSLGATRLFKIRQQQTRQVLDLHLTTGSVLLMQGDFQQHWQHCVPKTKRVHEERINLTFRKILS